MLEVISQVPRVNLLTLSEDAARKRCVDLAMENLSSATCDDDKTADRESFVDQLDTFTHIREGDYEVWLIESTITTNEETPNADTKD